jgi:hypothetical protein
MAEDKKRRNKPPKGLDTYLPKTPGRPWRARPSEVSGRSYNLRLQFGQIWDTVERALLDAQTAVDVLKALDLAGQYWRSELGPGEIPSLILTILRDPKFPKKRRQQQINFLADSLAAWGTVSPRRSRDICEQERKKEKKGHQILRREFYIECSCAYQGPARDNACRNCGAQIPDFFQSEWLEPKSDSAHVT